jgi:hypothetical protein
MHESPLTFPEILLFAALFGVLLHAFLLSRYVAKGEAVTGELTALLVIFFSGVWAIGPFTYFGFRNTRPLLAQACLRQLVTVTALWLVLVMLSASGVDFWNAGNEK